MGQPQIYHQCGHNYIWNLDSYMTDNVGDGMILSPVNMKSNFLINLDINLKKKSFFDPQFYLPKSTHKNLNSYVFFPNNVAKGYLTADYEEYAYESAARCVEFQMENDFKYIVIPTLYYEEVPNNYVEQLKELYIYPFLEEIRNRNSKTPVLLSMIVKDVHITNDDYTEELLGMLTSFSEVDGIYLIPYHKRTSKRIKDINYLYKLMVFIDILKSNRLEVHLGYIDIEGFLLSIANIDSVSIGSYENARSFNSTRYNEREKGKKMNGPTPRIYSSKLLQWIDHRYLDSIMTEYPQGNKLFDETRYKVLMFEPEYKWHFTKPELYKHYFISYSGQLKSLPNSFEKRYFFILDCLKKASEYFEEIKNEGILFDSDSDGSHIPYWGTAINRYYKYKRGV